jgi:hypothetical protein
MEPNKYREELEANRLAILLAMYPNAPWDWHVLSFNRCLTPQIVASYTSAKWNWSHLKTHGFLGGQRPRYPRYDTYPEPIEDVLASPLNHTWRASCHPGLTIEIIKSRPIAYWQWPGISENPAITLDNILAEPGLPWVWKNVSANPSIDWDTIKAHPRLQWDPECLLANPNITVDGVAEIMEMIEFEKSHWETLSKNCFNHHPAVVARLKRLANLEDLAWTVRPLLGEHILPVLFPIVLNYLF